MAENISVVPFLCYSGSMKLERAKNARQNLLTGMIYKIVLVFLPFLGRTVLIYTLGAEYNGLNGLFSSIFQILSLAELGVGEAIAYALYKPIAEEDTKTIRAILNLIRKAYICVGGVILSAGVCLVPFLDKMIKGGYPEELNISAVYLLYLITTVASYWAFGYRSVLLNAHQRMDVFHVTGIVVTAVLHLTQIAVLLLTKNYYLYMLVLLATTILNNVILYRTSKRLFPEYVCEGKVDRETTEVIKTKIKGLFLFRVCSVSRNSFDNIFISMYLGLTLSGIYNNYYSIMFAAIQFMSLFTTSILAGVGNSIVTETVEKNFSDMRRINCLYMMIAAWISTGLLCLFQPFMKIWLGEEMMLPMGAVVLIVLYFYLLKMGDVRAVYSDANGLWWENRYRTVLEAVLNVVLNYLFVKKWGVCGIIGATIITLFLFGFVGSAVILFKCYFKRGLMVFFKDHFLYFLGALVIHISAYGVCSLVPGEGIGSMMLKGIVCILIPAVFFAVFAVFNADVKDSVLWMKRKVFGK